MCRTKSEGGRRCICDSSQSRRLRKHNLEAKKRHSSALLERPTKTEEQAASSIIDPAVSLETIKEQIIEVEALKAYLNEISDKRNTLPLSFPPPNFTLPDGTIISISDYEEESILQIAAVLEVKTTEVGKGIADLAQQRTGVTDDYIAELSSQAVKQMVDKGEKFWEKESNFLKRKMEAFGDEGTKSHIEVFEAAVKAENPVAMKLFKEQQELAKEQAALREEAMSPAVAQGGAKAIALMERNREEKIKILSELRPLGGKIQTDEKSKPLAVATLAQVQNVYPTAWLEESNSLEPFIAKTTKGRAHYNDSATQTQKESKLARLSFSKPKNWEPDPHSKEDGGIWHKTDAVGRYFLPDTGKVIQAKVEQGQQGWVKEVVEWHNTWDGSVQETKPKGNGWVKTQVYGKQFNKVTGAVEKGPLVTGWYRPVKTMQTVGITKKHELMVPEDPKTAYAVGVHEFAHRIESTPVTGKYVTRLEEAFLRRRTTVNGVRENVKPLVARSREYGYSDDFIDNYMGRVYDKQNYKEVLSTGSEAIFGGAYGGLIGFKGLKKDHDMQGFILGLWATA